MTERVDFSSNATIYDRRHGAILAPEVARALAALAALESGSRVLDIGAGTGRVATAFASFGCRVVALEPAVKMLGELQRKVAGQPVRVVAGEGARLPFPRSFFDAVVLARVLYVMADWQAVLREAHDALKPGGYILHEWGNGDARETWVHVRERLRTLFQEAGVEHPFHPGARTEADVDAHLEHLGVIRSAVLPGGPGPSLTLRQFVERIVSGEFSYVWNVPSAVRERCLMQLSQWCDHTFDPEQSFPMPRELQWTIFRKKDA
ncbi:MAG: methyltransferase domain-containing protein [Cyanobacteria bacterium]|nr:methyltransferase domain-containing protein [Cyanobacteriota bacterium]